MLTYRWFVPPAPPANDHARLHPARWSGGKHVVRDMMAAYPGVLVLCILSYLIGSGISAFVPVVVGMIVDGLLGDDAFDAWWLFALLIGIFVIQFIGEATARTLILKHLRVEVSLSVARMVVSWLCNAGIVGLAAWMTLRGSITHAELLAARGEIRATVRRLEWQWSLTLG